MLAQVVITMLYIVSIITVFLDQYAEMFKVANKFLNVLNDCFCSLWYSEASVYNLIFEAENQVLPIDCMRRRVNVCCQ